jgi:Icc-related predicted phosphoesterase
LAVKRLLQALAGKRSNPMDINVTVISDTHCRHGELKLPAGDLLIHCGDLFEFGFENDRQIAEMDEWFGRQRFERILCTGGNHDIDVETALAERTQPFRNAWFLHDETVEFRGLKIHGAPWVNDLPGHAFYKDHDDLKEAWARVPEGLDILITHTPPAGILDTSSRGRSYGCRALAEAMPRIAPRVHVFGHVHASRGHRTIGSTQFINASSLHTGSGVIRPPITFTLSPS